MTIESDNRDLAQHAGNTCLQPMKAKIKKIKDTNKDVDVFLKIRTVLLF